MKVSFSWENHTATHNMIERMMCSLEKTMKYAMTEQHVCEKNILPNSLFHISYETLFRQGICVTR